MKIGWSKKSAVRLRSETLVRIAGLAAWAMLGITGLLVPPTLTTEPQFPLPDVLGGVAFIGFGLAFWYNTRAISSRRFSVALLAFQAATGFMVNTDLMYIVAAEIPLVLSSRAAVYWIAGQTILLTVWISWLDMQGYEVGFLTIPQLPHPVVVLVTDLSVFAFHGFAFCMGYLAATEARGRREAERINAELVATRELLAQTSRMAERGYIAQELHDTLGHHLVALKLNLELAQRLTEGQAVTSLSDARGLVDGLLSSVREVVSSVRAQPAIDLRRAVEMLLAGITELSIQLVFPEDLEVDDPAHAHALFRCIQEAVTNMIKHAHSHRLWIEFEHDEQRITLHIRDDGQGTARVMPGYGLTGMRERLESSGGALDIQTDAGRGFALTAWVPKTVGYR